MDWLLHVRDFRYERAKNGLTTITIIKLKNIVLATADESIITERHWFWKRMIKIRLDYICSLDKDSNC